MQKWRRYSIMKAEIVNKLLILMMEELTDEQLRILKNNAYIALEPYQISTKTAEIIPYDNTDMVLLQKFLEAKMASGAAKGTLKQYKNQLQIALASINKSISSIDEDDIREFFNHYQRERKVNNTTLRNMRAYLNSFFGWLRRNRYIKENPMDLVDAIKAEITIKEPYTDEDLVKLRDACDKLRDLALMDFLNASMVRIGELQQLDIKDIDFTERECIVYGKGRKERIAYFDGMAKIHIQEYIESREDSDKALFLSKRGTRMSIRGLQKAIKRTGIRAGVEKAHAHRFRRTGATRCLEMGIPLDQVQELLGHASISTTQIYAKTRRNIIKNNYMRLYS